MVMRLNIRMRVMDSGFVRKRIALGRAHSDLFHASACGLEFALDILTMTLSDRCGFPCRAFEASDAALGGEMEFKILFLSFQVLQFPMQRVKILARSLEFPVCANFLPADHA
jgi:hypothetical protein